MNDIDEDTPPMVSYTVGPELRTIAQAPTPHLLPCSIYAQEETADDMRHAEADGGDRLPLISVSTST